MEICRLCHDKDADAIKCIRPSIEHHKVGIFKCGICGKDAVIYICHKYNDKYIKQIKNMRG